MPVVTPKASGFQGSKIVTNNTPWIYIRNDVPQIDFGKEYPSKGKTFIFLPSYKTDDEGNGAWYKPIKIRSDFGTGLKSRASYYIPDVNKDPGTYFEKQLRAKYPDLHRAVERTDGIKGKVYPACGRIVNRVIYNVVEYTSLKEGVAVSDAIKVANVASNGIADALDAHMRVSDPVTGIMNTIICDPEAATPVTITKVTGAGGNPWKVSFSSSKVNLMTPKLQKYADMDNLVNLDDIFIDVDPSSIIEDLRSFFDRDVFEDCMDGFLGYSEPTVRKSAPVVKAKPKVVQPVEEEQESELPDLSQDFKQDDDDIPFEAEEEKENPIKKAPPTKMSKGDLTKYLRQK